jgi:hypothetical protein
MLTGVPDPDGGDRSVGGPVPSGSVVDEIVRDGARRMLAEALQAEVDAYIVHSRASATSAAAAWRCGTGRINLARF